MFKVAKKAVQCFEKWSSTRVSLHGFNAQWSALLPVEYSIHRHAACREVKRHIGDDICIKCDMVQLREVLSDYPDGGIKICPSGIAEWFLPISSERGVQALLFAGMRQVDPDQDFELPVFKSNESVLKHIQVSAPHLKRDEESLIMEGLHQLAARLAQLFILDNGSGSSIPRGEKIMHIIRKHYRNPDLSAILCSELSLSESRMRHVVTTETGSSLQELIINIRLYRIQMELLHSDRTIAEIAWTHGFSNLAHFYRTFKAHFRLSPKQFRQKRGIID